MNSDKILGRWLVVLLLLPVALAFAAGDRFRYPCQNPANWDKDMCKAPQCSVTGTCPENIFKGEPPKGTATPKVTVATEGKGCN
jgi:hypothetical protein